MSLEQFADSRLACELLGQLLLGERRWGRQALTRISAAFLRDDSKRPPYQDCAIFIPGLAGGSWSCAQDLPLARRLEEAWPLLQHELRTAVSQAHFEPYRQDNDRFLDLEHWSTADLLVLGREHANGRLAPRTLELIRDARAPAEMVALSRLAPGGRIRPHCGPWNTRITIHLAIEAPSGCRMRVGQEWREWAVGRCTVFDDSFEHECINESPSNRTVLLLDVWNPALEHPELAVLKAMLEILQRDFWSARDGARKPDPDAVDPFRVVNDDRGHCALWPAELAVPPEWHDAFGPANKQACLGWVRAHVKDGRIRPGSVADQTAHE